MRLRDPPGSGERVEWRLYLHVCNMVANPPSKSCFPVISMIFGELIDTIAN